jgi:hypothetical protein
MPDIIEEVISNWFISKGYFVINNLKVGVNEIDLLAVKFKNGIIDQKIHIEVQASSNPIGYIGGSSSAKTRSESQIRTGVRLYIEKKFTQNKIKKVVESYFGKEYEKWFICGALKDERTIQIFEQNQIKVFRVWEILDEYKSIFKNKKNYLGTAQGNRYQQLLVLSQNPSRK